MLAAAEMLLARFSVQELELEMSEREEMSHKLAEVAGAIRDLSEVKRDQEEPSRRTLSGALNEVRGRQADRDDVVIDMAHAERSRLELLAAELHPVFDELDDRLDMFDFAITNGNPARLWIDMTSFVVMTGDRRSYRFVKDTRLGRTVLAESVDLNQMADHVTNYIAERVLMHERMLEGDWISLRQEAIEREQLLQQTAVKGEKVKQTEGSGSAVAVKSKRGSRTKRGSLLSFMLGILFGAIALFAWAWFNVPPAF